MRMRAELGISLVEIENARSLRERPTNPDAFDLMLAGTLNPEPAAYAANATNRCWRCRASPLA